jgi:small subunit ribosomal protein S8
VDTLKVTDPIADMLTRVRNASAARHEQVDLPASELKIEIARILKEEGYIRGYRIMTEDKHRGLRVLLKYTASGEPAITACRVCSAGSAPRS